MFTHIMHILGPLSYHFIDIILLVALILLLKSFVSAATHSKHSKQRRQRSHYPGFGAGIILFFIIINQGYWQIFGHLHPGLFRFQSTYDPRHRDSMRRILRGTIYDRNERILARTDSGTYERIYPYGASAAHITGYHDPVFGNSGLEDIFNHYLMGRTAGSVAELRNYLRNGFFRDSLKGNDLHTTIDIELQQTGFEYFGARRGAVIVLNPQKAEILTLTNSPSFEPGGMTNERFRALRSNPQSPFLNRATQGLYPPGSTFKVFTAACALEEGLTPLLDCPAEGYRPPETDRWIRDHEYHEAQRYGGHFSGYRNMGLQDALVRSSNVYFSQLGVMLGASRMHKHISGAGFDRQFPLTGYSMFQESLMVKKSRIALTDTTSPAFVALTAIGQGKVSVRPMHMALLYSIVANDGVLLKPQLMPISSPGLREISLSSQTCRYLRDALYQVIERGTGRSLRIPGLEIAGKTGTADNPHGAPHSWFISFAPKDSPTFLVAAVIENAGAGAGAAAILSRKIYDKAIELQYLQPEQIILQEPILREQAGNTDAESGDL